MNNMATWAGERRLLGGKRVRWKTQRTGRGTSFQKYKTKKSLLSFIMIVIITASQICIYGIILMILIILYIFVTSHDKTDYISRS